MMGRSVFAALAIAAAGSAGCKLVSDPPRSVVVQDVEFLRGCWVAKTAPGGAVTAFLRLLPEGAGGVVYQGYLQIVSDGQATSPMHLSFSRDGSSMTIRRDRGGPLFPMDRSGGLARPYAPVPDAIGAKLPRAAHRVTYAVYPGQPQTPWIAAEGDGDRLVIYAMGNGGEHLDDIFNGERDGCD